jgi:hypothetical protein
MDVVVFVRSRGEPLLLGPGAIHAPQAAEPRISERELSNVVVLFANLSGKLQRMA